MYKKIFVCSCNDIVRLPVTLFCQQLEQSLLLSKGKIAYNASACLSLCLTILNFVYRVRNAIKQGLYLLEGSSEEAEQEYVFGLTDCPSDDWQNQMEKIHMVITVLTIASILHHMRPATIVPSI